MAKCHREISSNARKKLLRLKYLSPSASVSYFIRNADSRNESSQIHARLWSDSCMILAQYRWRPSSEDHLLYFQCSQPFLWWCTWEYCILFWLFQFHITFIIFTLLICQDSHRRTIACRLRHYLSHCIIDSLFMHIDCIMYINAFDSISLSFTVDEYFIRLYLKIIFRTSLSRHISRRFRVIPSLSRYVIGEYKHVSLSLLLMSVAPFIISWFMARINDKHELIAFNFHYTASVISVALYDFKYWFRDIPWYAEFRW